MTWPRNTPQSHFQRQTYLPAHMCEYIRTMMTSQTAGSLWGTPPHRRRSSATSSPGPTTTERRFHELCDSLIELQFVFKIQQRTRLTSLQNLRSTDFPSLRTQSSMRVLMPFPHTALSLSWQVLQSVGWSDQPTISMQPQKSLLKCLSLSPTSNVVWVLETVKVKFAVLLLLSWWTLFLLARLAEWKGTSLSGTVPTASLKNKRSYLVLLILTINNKII